MGVNSRRAMPASGRSRTYEDVTIVNLKDIRWLQFASHRYPYLSSDYPLLRSIEEDGNPSEGDDVTM
eukprot:scaffold246131_cov44-Prasinocladus_malaysianus.AAC.2